MTIAVFTAPAYEPITLEEAKTQCHIDHADEDDLITLLISSARQHAETQLARSLITQTQDAYFDKFPAFFKLPPMQSVTAITYVDENGDTQTLAADQYIVDIYSIPCRVTPAYDVTWPATRDQVNAVKVRFVAGYGAPSAVPACIKNWMLIRIATLYENRQQLTVDVKGMVELPPVFIDSLLDSERIYGRL